MVAIGIIPIIMMARNETIKGAATIKHTNLQCITYQERYNSYLQCHTTSEPAATQEISM
jgi:hypothetical protein